MSELKTTPDIGTYFPMKVPVKDDEMHYLVPVMKWHNTEHDAQLAHQFLAALARKDAALKLAVEAMEWARQNLDHQYNRCFTYTHNSECVCRIQDVEAALAACRAELEGK